MKRFLPLIITSAVLVTAIIANIIVACIDVTDLPAITYNDMPDTDAAYSDYQTAQQKYDEKTAKIDELDSNINKKQVEIDGYQDKISDLNASLDELRSQQSETADIAERYGECVAEAQRLYDMWSVYSDMKITHIDANYDTNNLRANQNNSNLYSVIGDFTGFFGQLLSSSMDTNIYNGFDKIIAAVDTITNTVNEHIYKADMLLSKIQTEIAAAKTLITEDLSGERLLFEIELFESAYFGNDDLFETERKELVYELSYSKAVLDAVYLVYEMMLSDSSDNSDFLIRLKNKAIEIEDYMYSICTPEDELLTAEEIGEITYNTYQLFPMICDVMFDPSFLYKDVRTVNHNVSYGLGVGDKMKQGIKNESYTFAMRLNDVRNEEIHTSYYFSPDGQPVYIEDHAAQVCLINGEVVYTNWDERMTEEIIEEAKEFYEKYNKV